MLPVGTAPRPFAPPDCRGSDPRRRRAPVSPWSVPARRQERKDKSRDRHQRPATGQGRRSGLFRKPCARGLGPALALAQAQRADRPDDSTKRQGSRTQRQPGNLCPGGVGQGMECGGTDQTGPRNTEHRAGKVDQNALARRRTHGIAQVFKDALHVNDA